MKRFKSARHVQRFVSIHDPIANLFHLRRDHVTASQYRAARSQAFEAWAEIAGARLAA
jgi:putative transposase